LLLLLLLLICNALSEFSLSLRVVQIVTIDYRGAETRDELVFGDLAIAGIVEDWLQHQHIVVSQRVSAVGSDPALEGAVADPVLATCVNLVENLLCLQHVLSLESLVVLLHEQVRVQEIEQRLEPGHLLHLLQLKILRFLLLFFKLSLHAPAHWSQIEARLGCSLQDGLNVLSELRQRDLHLWVLLHHSDELVQAGNR